jgi:hypothetical protein
MISRGPHGPCPLVAKETVGRIKGVGHGPPVEHFVTGYAVPPIRMIDRGRSVVAVPVTLQAGVVPQRPDSGSRFERTAAERRDHGRCDRRSNKAHHERSAPRDRGVMATPIDHLVSGLVVTQLVSESFDAPLPKVP